jgi:hypothetical protein
MSYVLVCLYLSQRVQSDKEKTFQTQSCIEILAPYIPGIKAFFLKACLK